MKYRIDVSSEVDNPKDTSSYNKWETCYSQIVEMSPERLSELIRLINTPPAQTYTVLPPEFTDMKKGSI
jgi:hypothetical protein